MNRRPGRSALIAVFAFVRLGAAAGPQAQPSRSLAATAPVLTIPAVASVRGVNGTSFRSDLWLLNRSHESAATVVLTYHVFTALGGGTFESTLTLEPRQSALLEDVVATRLARPGSA